MSDPLSGSSDSFDGTEVKGTRPELSGPVANRQRNRPYLLVFEQEAAWMFELPDSGEVIIGRAEGVQVRLRDNAVSRRHARIVMNDGQATVTDLGSQNGTLVQNERVVGARTLVPSDCVTVCGASLVFYADSQDSMGQAFLEIEAFRRHAEQELSRAQRHGRPLAMVAFALGLGPAARPAIASRIGPLLRSSDIACWSAADRLLILTPETGPDAVAGICARLSAAVVDLVPEARAGYATYPIDGCDVRSLVESARSASEAASVGTALPASELAVQFEIGGRAVIAADAAMLRLYELVRRLAASNLPILVSGETGTGKELVASAIHEWSSRCGKPRVALNGAALPETLVESELFGHARGAFSGADATKAGLLESAMGGTVFLDEVGELSAAVQAKLLRVLEEKRVCRLGEVREREVDIRIVAATNRDLRKEVAAGRFREDLYFRLNAATIWLPPLRDRTRELALLARSFLAQACARAGRSPMSLSVSAMRALGSYRWPGNVRELRNLMDYLAAAIPDSTIEEVHLVDRLHLPPDRREFIGSVASFRPIDEEIRELERSRMASALAASGGHRRRAADLIHMPLRTFMTKAKLYGLSGTGGRDSGS